MRWMLVVIGIVIGLAAAARADGVFETSIGYSHLSLNGSDRFEQRDGLRIEPRFSLNPFENAPQLRLGFGLGISTYYHQLDRDSTIIVNDGDEITVFHADQWEVLSLLEPEFQLSWHQALGDGRWFVEPGLGIGAAIANYGISSGWGWSDDDSEWDSTFEVRPFLRMGYRTSPSRGGWSFGGEVSYMVGGNVDLTPQVKGDLREFYAGGFFGFTW